MKFVLFVKNFRLVEGYVSIMSTQKIGERCPTFNEEVSYVDCCVHTVIFDWWQKVSRCQKLEISFAISNSMKHERLDAVHNRKDIRRAAALLVAEEVLASLA